MAPYGATAKPESHPRTHGEKPSAGWDYAFVFDARADPNDSPTPADLFRNKVLSNLIQTGFSYHQRWIPADQIVIVRFALPQSTMMTKAELQRLELQTQPRYGGGYMPFTIEKARVFVNQDRLDHGQPYFTANDRVLLTLAILRSSEIWGSSLDIPNLLFTKQLKHAFAIHSEPDRSALVKAILVNQWWNPIRRMPLTPLKEYFGTNVTLYVAWIGFYTRILFALAVFSIPVQYVVSNYYFHERLSATVRVIFALVLCFWSCYGLERWNRRNAVLNVQWGMSRYYEDIYNVVRPDFKGEPRKGFYCPGGFVGLDDLDATEESSELQRCASRTDTLAIVAGVNRAHRVFVLGGRKDRDFAVEAAVTDLTFSDLPTMPYFDKKLRVKRTKITTLVTILCSFVVAIITFLILMLQTEIVSLLNLHSIARYVPGIILGFFISFVDAKWAKISTRLTTWENHQTDHLFEKSLIRKRFAFQFVSNYLPLFYIGFVKPFFAFTPCHVGYNSDVPDCMAELGSMLAALVVIKATVQQAMELGKPTLFYRMKKWKEKRANGSADQSELENLMSHDDDEVDANGIDNVLEESKMAPYPSTHNDYEEIVIQHGFLALFGVAFPLAALINYMNNFIECRTDTYKMLVITQRTNSANAADIGGWKEMLDFLTTLSIITNAGLLTITSLSLQKALPNFIGDTAENHRVLSFLIFEHILLAIRWSVGAMITARPSSTHRILARQDFLLAKCFNVGWKPFYRGEETKAKELPSLWHGLACRI